MKAVEITELPEVEVSEEGLIPIVDPLNGVSRVKLKHVRGVSVQSQETFFLVTDVNTGVDISTSGWETTPSNTTGDNRYLWSYNKFTYQDGHIVNTPPAVIGVYGDTGNGILSSEYYYLATSKSTDVTKDEAGWTTTPQHTTDTEKYLWSYVHTEYTDGTQTDSTPVVIGTKGDKGDVGKPFTIAKTYTSIEEMNNAFATDGVEEGSFVVIDTGDINDEDNAKLYLKGSTAYMYITDMSGIQGLQGPKGDKGETGATGLQGPKGDKGDSGIAIGHVYIQFRGQSAPADLYPGTTWSNISSTYAGRFFRAEGGSAASFGSTQAGGLPNIVGKYIRDTSQNTLEGSWSGVFYGYNFRTGISSGDANSSYYGAQGLGFDASRSNSLYGAASEVRPVNETFRIWKRTA